MSNKLWKVLLASPALLGIGISSTAIANEAPTIESLEAPQETSVDLAQVTSVNELTDVLPTDWAFTALQNLVETYGCIEGFPNRTYRGQQPLTRYEFAAGLNACLDVIATLITGGEGFDESTLATIQRLQDEFQAELATLRGRVDALEAEVAELRSQQFSTTTKLRGQVDANLIVPGGSLDTPGAGEDSSATFNTRARLNFDASFTGEDRLRIRLQSGDNDDALEAAGGLANATDDDFGVSLNDFFYTFPIGERIDVIIGANSIITDDFVTTTIVPFDGPSVADPGGPVLYDAPGLGGAGAAAGFNVAVTDNIVIDAGYSADEGFSADADNGGIFGAGSQSYIVQANYLTNGLINGALVYARGTDDDIVNNTYAGLLSLDFGRFIVSGYGAFHDMDGGGAEDDVSWMAGVAVPDLFLEGSQLGVYYADLVTSTAGQNPFIVEGYYEVPVNQFLTITPAVIFGDLDTDNGDDTQIYGAVRATFRF